MSMSTPKGKTPKQTPISSVVERLYQMKKPKPYNNPELTLRPKIIPYEGDKFNEYFQEQDIVTRLSNKRNCFTPDKKVISYTTFHPEIKYNSKYGKKAAGTLQERIESQIQGHNSKISTKQEELNKYLSEFCTHNPEINQEFFEKNKESEKLGSRLEPGYASKMLFRNTDQWNEVRSQQQADWESTHLSNKVLEAPDIYKVNRFKYEDANPKLWKYSHHFNTRDKKIGEYDRNKFKKFTENLEIAKGRTKVIDLQSEQTPENWLNKMKEEEKKFPQYTLKFKPTLMKSKGRPASSSGSALDRFERFYKGKDHEFEYQQFKDMEDRRSELNFYYPWMVRSVSRVLERNPETVSYTNPLLNKKTAMKDFNKTF